MSYILSDAVRFIKHPLIKGSVKNVLHVIAGHSSNTGDNIFPSLKVMSEQCGFSRDTVMRGIKKLKSINLITNILDSRYRVRKYKIELSLFISLLTNERLKYKLTNTQTISSKLQPSSSKLQPSSSKLQPSSSKLQPYINQSSNLSHKESNNTYFSNRSISNSKSIENSQDSNKEKNKNSFDDYEKGFRDDKIEAEACHSRKRYEDNSKTKDNGPRSNENNFPNHRKGWTNKSAPEMKNKPFEDEVMESQFQSLLKAHPNAECIPHCRALFETKCKELEINPILLIESLSKQIWQRRRRQDLGLWVPDTFISLLNWLKNHRWEDIVATEEQLQIDAQGHWRSRMSVKQVRGMEEAADEKALWERMRKSREERERQNANVPKQPTFQEKRMAEIKAQAEVEAAAGSQRAIEFLKALEAADAEKRDIINVI